MNPTKILVFLAVLSILTTTNAKYLEPLKAVFHGICFSLRSECDINSVLDCWEEDSASKLLKHLTTLPQEVSTHQKEEPSKIVNRHFTIGGRTMMGSLWKVWKCGSQQKFSQMLNETLGMNVWTEQFLMDDMAKYAGSFAVDFRLFMLTIAHFEKKGNYDAIGKILGTLFMQVSDFTAGFMKPPTPLEESERPTAVSEDYYEFLYGFCTGLGLNCSMDSKDCWDNHDSSRIMQWVYEFSSNIASFPKKDMQERITGFLNMVHHDLLRHVDKHTWDCQAPTNDRHLIVQRLKGDPWSTAELMSHYAMQAPDDFYFLMQNLLSFMMRKNYEGAGLTFAFIADELDEFRHLQKKRSTRKMPNEDPTLIAKPYNSDL